MIHRQSALLTATVLAALVSVLAPSQARSGADFAVPKGVEVSKFFAISIPGLKYNSFKFLKSLIISPSIIMPCSVTFGHFFTVKYNVFKFFKSYSPFRCLNRPSDTFLHD